VAQADFFFQSFNVGQVDEDKLHRVDLAKMRLAAEVQDNIVPLNDGRGVFRPGLGYLATVKASNPCRPIAFVAGSSTAYGLELTDGILRVMDCSTDTIITRPSVTSTVTNGDFSSGVGWTLATTSGQTSSITGGKLELSARAHGGRASATRTFTINETTTIHGLSITVDRGPVMFRLGSSSGDDDLIAETSLLTGNHSLAFDPDGAGTAYIQFFSTLPYKVIVDEIIVESAGAMEVATPWDIDEIWQLEVAQSLDVMYVGVGSSKQMRIERRGDGAAAGLSWSVVDYMVDDGPFTALRTADVTIKPSATEGDITLTADRAFFKSTHVGALFKVWHTSQRIDTYLAGLDKYTPTFLVTGITETNFEERKWAVAITGTWVGTIKTRRSFDGEDIEFHDVRREQASSTINITANATYTNDDNDDNTIAWYKYGFTSYTSGEARVIVTYEGGGGYGIARVTGFTSSTVVTAQVLKPFLGDTASDDWQEGQWSERMGYPSGVALGGGRLWWTGDDAVWGSISDAYSNFDEEYDGDAGPISRAIALGGRNEGRWMLSLSQILLGCDSRIAAVRASSLDEIITPTNFDVKNVDKVPCARVTPVELRNDRGLFVADSGTSVYEVSQSGDGSGKFIASRFSLLSEASFQTGITQMVVQNFPDQRIWVSAEDYGASMILYEPLLDISAVVPISLSGTDIIEGVIAVPGSIQDRLYAITKRTVNGATVRFWEKLALDSEAVPADVCKICDAFVSGTGAHSATITGLDHIEGRTVVAWVDGAPVEDSPGVPTEFIVTGGQITLPTAPTAGYCVGLQYTGRYKSSRLAYGAEGTSPFLKGKVLARAGLLLADYARWGIKIGGQFDDDDHPLRNLPELDNSTGTTATDVVEGVGNDEDGYPIDADWKTDPRFCLEVKSPYPMTLRALILTPEI
jgi:hypothetical protein